MTDLANLKADYEKADAAARKLSGEHQAKIDKLVEKRAELKSQYQDKIAAANEKARAAQKAYCDAEALDALLDRPEGRSVAETIVKSGGFTQAQVNEAFGE